MVYLYSFMVEETDEITKWLSLLKDPNPTIRSHATYSLRKHSDPRVIPALIEALKDHEKSVRRNASKALGYKKAEEAIPALEELMNDADHYVRNDAVKAIRKIKGISSN